MAEAALQTPVLSVALASLEAMSTKHRRRRVAVLFEARQIWVAATAAEKNTLALLVFEKGIVAGLAEVEEVVIGSIILTQKGYRQDETSEATKGKEVLEHFPSFPYSCL